MKIFLIKGFSFLIAFIVLYVACVYAIGGMSQKRFRKTVMYVRNGYGFMSTRMAEAEKSGPVDVLAIGSSHVYRGYDPRIFKQYGISLFNMGSSAQSPVQSEYLIKKYIDKLKPKVVVLDVDYTEFENEGIESAIDIFSNVPSFDKGLLTMALKLNSIPGYNTYIYSYIKTLQGVSVDTARERDMDIYIPGGFVQRDVKANEYVGQLIPATVIKMNNMQLKALQHIIEILKEKNIKLILVQTPAAPDQVASIKNSDSLDHYFSSLKGVEYHNFNDTNMYKNNCFFDYAHLNATGVAKYDSIFINTLFPGGKL